LLGEGAVTTVAADERFPEIVLSDRIGLDG
jgi:hypothetical protein